MTIPSSSEHPTHSKHFKAFKPMSGRSPHEHPRVATTLELFFDLISDVTQP